MGKHFSTRRNAQKNIADMPCHRNGWLTSVQHFPFYFFTRTVLLPIACILSCHRCASSFGRKQLEIVMKIVFLCAKPFYILWNTVMLFFCATFSLVFLFCPSNFHLFSNKRKKRHRRVPCRRFLSEWDWTQDYFHVCYLTKLSLLSPVALPTNKLTMKTALLVFQ